VGNLEARGRVEDAGGLLRLTADGAREQAARAPRIDDVRQRISVARPQDDYVTLVRLLARLTEAL